MRKVRGWVPSLAILVLAIGAAFVGWSRFHRSGSNEVEAYLKGQGAVIIRFRSLSAPLLELDASTSASYRKHVCSSVATKLNRAVKPDALFAASASIPDPFLAELAIDDRAARSEALIACGAGKLSETNAALRAVNALDALFTKRLEEL